MIPVNDHMYTASMFDPELGVGSSEAMQIELEYSHGLASRYHRPFSIVVAELDAYSDYAGYYGRKAAKLAQKLMAEHIRHSCRSVDRIYRCDDTGILLILPETGFSGAVVLSERLVKSFAQRAIANVNSEHQVLTISASPVACDPQSVIPATWSEMLDEALLYIKVAQGQGGNRICHRELIAEQA